MDLCEENRSFGRSSRERSLCHEYVFHQNGFLYIWCLFLVYSRETITDFKILKITLGFFSEKLKRTTRVLDIKFPVSQKEI